MAHTVFLARKLGLIETIGTKNVESKTEFTHVIVIDFESTCWSDRRLPSEIIEFPAVLLELSSGKILSEFHHYVSPTENPILSDFCKNLTGITQCQVEDAMPLKTILHLFQQWYSNILKRMNCTIIPFVTWSDWDFGTCLHKECQRKAIRKPDIFNSWIDLRALFKAHTNKPTRGLKAAMSDLGLIFEGREHSGIIDARNTAKLTWKLHTEGLVLKITKDVNKSV